MNKTGELIFIHVWIVLWIIICASFIWGDFAEKSYNSRMKWRKWLMPGRWADKEYFIRLTKRFFYFSLPFGILIYFLVIFSIFNNCAMLIMEDVPSEELIRKWDDIQPFIIEPGKITGIYRSADIDAIVFKYSTVADKAKFWAHLQSNLQGTKWKLITETSDSRAYERRFSKGDGSPGRPDIALFSSAELLKLEYLPGKQTVIVGYVQADSSEKDASFAATDEAKWAEKEIWPRFNKAKN